MLMRLIYRQCHFHSPMPFYNQTQDPRQYARNNASPTTHSPPACSTHSWYTIRYSTITEYMFTEYKSSNFSQPIESTATYAHYTGRTRYDLLNYEHFEF